LAEIQKVIKRLKAKTERIAFDPVIQPLFLRSAGTASCYDFTINQIDEMIGARLQGIKLNLIV
jgi:hypothetical protein